MSQTIGTTSSVAPRYQTVSDSELDIGRILERLAESQPSAPAIHAPGRSSLSYAELGAQIRYVRERLKNWGIARGDVVAGVIATRPELAVACATVPAAATFAPLSLALTADGYAEMFRRLRAKVLIVAGDLSQPAREAARRVAVTTIELVADPNAPAGMFTLDLARRYESLDRKACARVDMAYVLNTSGTTGRPKLVPVTHRRLTMFAKASGDWLQLAPNDIGCHLVPMHHGHGLNFALMIPLLRGASVVCLPESDIDGFFAALENYQPTWLTAVFTVQRAILRRAPDFRDAVAANKLRFIRVGSGRLEPEEIDRIERTFRAPVLMALTAQEVFSITHDPLPPSRRKPGSVGLPLCNEVIVKRENGEVCSAEETGEIVVRGPLVFDGYFDDPQLTAETLVDGWFRTGDLGHFDKDGYLHVVGRIKELINRGGEKISSVEIDAAIEAVPGVRAAATFGVAHRTLGEEVVAAVVRDGSVGIEESDITNHLRQRMGPGRIPRQIYFVDHLPRTDGGKIRRSELSKLLGLDQPNVILSSASHAKKPCAGTVAGMARAIEAGELATRLSLSRPVASCTASAISSATTISRQQRTAEPPDRVTPSNPYIIFKPEEVEQSIAARFEHQVRCWAERTAVKTAHQELTYAALNRAANRLAHCVLQERGRGAEPVALLLEHDAPMVIALLAVLKAGKFYVPLDPAYSREHLACILDDSQAGIVLTSNALIGVASELAGPDRRVLSVDAPAANYSTENPDLTISPDAYAYLVYTSGSSGHPKGVIENQRNVLHFTMVRTNSCHIAAEDRLALLLSFSFSGSATPLFAALLNGAGLHLRNISETGPMDLANWLDAEQISVCFVGASLFRQLVNTLDGTERFSHLRLIRVGGEPVYRNDVELFRKHFPSTCRLLNSIGSSEMKNFAEYFIDHNNAFEGDLVPVGYAVEDTELLLVDDNKREVGIGEIGEIVVKSRYIAPGYWHRPELTQKTFQLAPEGDDERLYYTGDLGRLQPDGALVHLGRKDFQVKIRGHRVELGEVEGALLGLDGVSAAVVVACETKPGERRLVAYVVLDSAHEPRVDAWRSALRSKLTDYMIPASFIVLESLPLTPNGKVDRAKLPQPDRDRPMLETRYMAPSSQLENVLATVWAEVLNLDRVGTHDNFNALGGDSLRGARLLTAVKAVFGVDLPFQLLFEDAATVAGMARAIENSRARAATASHESDDVAAPMNAVIAHRQISGPAVLSDTQKRMWFLSKFNPQSPAYHECRAFRVTGEFNVDALRRALRLLTQRHEILRTTYVLVDDEPRQIVREDAVIDLRSIDLTATPEAQREDAMQRALRVETEIPFDLECGPLLRCCIARQDAREHVFLRAWHHIISDGWSGGIFDRELSIAYGAYARGEEPALPQLPIQYADYAVWQREWLQGEVLERQLSYWKAKLAGLTTLELPTDRPRPAVQSHRGAHVVWDLSEVLTRELKALGRREGATLFMTLLAAFQVLLHRYSGQDDIAVGVPIAGRGRAELEGLIGFFANTLVLRSDLSGDPGFRALLAQVRTSALGAYTHQDVPFEKLVGELAPSRDLSRNPLFQVMFALQNAPGSALALEGVQVSRLPLEGRSAKFDLSLSVRETAAGLHTNWEFSTDLFDAQTIERMARHFERLLEGIVADQEQCIGALPLLTEAERHQLLVEWNDTAVDYPRDRCIQELFEEQAARAPEAVAVVFEDEQLTYGELNARANCLAHHLIGLGVGPEVLVGICMERSLQLMIGLLGILKAGAAYVPLDPSYPPQRLRFMLEDTGAPVLLTQQALRERLIPYDGRIVCVDQDWLQISTHGKANPPTTTNAASLAYVIYTSGSTGEPKGACITHGGLVNYLSWATEFYAVASGTSIPVHSSIAFDLTVTSLFAPLIAQRTVELLPEDQGVEALVQRWERAGSDFSLIMLAPAHLELLAARIPAQQISGRVRALIIGGEQLRADTIAFWRRHAPSTMLVNEYGPSETVVGCCVYKVPADALAHGSIPIGRPIANTRIYILDKHGEPAPIGVPGGLYVGGAGLARGYLNRPQLSAESFLPDRFSDAPGARIYRTGDLARYLSDGNIEFIGRIDQQVNIRGFRIEPGEIEAVLAADASVRQAVVAAREDTPGEKRLVAYVVPAAISFSGTQRLRALLSERLPEYMLPSAYVVLENMPLMPNGKVDRRALPAPEYCGDGLSSAYVAPRHSLEEMTAEIWREVLNLERVGVHDNFFELGGHSLLAAQIVARLAKLLMVEFPLRRLFEAPTVARLAAEAKKILGGDGTREAVPISRLSRGSQSPLSYAQQRLWFLARLWPDKGAYNILSAWRLHGALDTRALQRSLDELVARHESLRTTFALSGAQPVQVISRSNSSALVVTDLSAMPQAERETRSCEITRAEAELAFDLEAGPLLRAQLLRLAAEEHLLLLNVHHIISDGWSGGIFDRELSIAYGAYARGEEPALPQLPIQYADYAVWQREWLQGEVLERQLSYWKAKLAGLTTLELPTDRPRPAVQSHRGAHVVWDLSEVLTRELKALGRREGATLFMTLLAAFQVLLHRYSGQDDIAVGVPIAGRGRAELEGLIGFFANTLVLRSDLSGDPGFRALLAQVRTSALGAYTHQDVPFEKLVGELAPSRDLSRNPLFQVMFALQNAPGSALALEGVQVSRLPLEGRSAKFDLSLSVRETAAGLHTNWEFSTDLFDAQTIERMARHFERLLEGIVADQEQCIGALPLLTEAERHQLLVEWNDTAVDYPRDRCIQELFEEQAARAPEAVAVVFEDEQLTYGELNARANCLAHHLIGLGVGPEVLVGICMERSLQLMIGLLGILKAGAAYVPLDPSYPPQRLRFMLEDTGAPVLLTQQALRERLIPYDGRIVCVDQDWLQISTHGKANPPTTTNAASLAYVIYTSGSTGEPKGVLVPHRGVVRLVKGTDYVSLSANDTLLHLAPLAFDASTFELWGALLNGGCVALLPPGRPTLAEIGEAIRRHDVTTLWLPAGLFHLMVDEQLDALKPLRQLLAGGDVLSSQHLVKARRALSGCRLINGYGPTENTTFTCCYAVADESALIPTVPIGRPIANTRVYILDRNLEPVPIGVAGVLYTGGDGLARGYWKRPELDAERFVPDRYAATPGARLYCTGDRARYLSDGNIEFLGRADRQIKLRGFRVELGEIEEALREHSAVRQAVVGVHDEINGGRRLTAYVVPVVPSFSDIESLRAKLCERLPDYMRPSEYVVLERLPLTQNGKVDLRALLALASEIPRALQAYSAPRDKVERTLCRIWEEMLGVARVGLDDNFFELGGHSLLAAGLFSRLAQALQCSLPLATLFEAPTVRGLARFYRDGAEPKFSSALIPIAYGGSLPPIFAVPGVYGNVVCFAEIARELGPEQPFYGLQSFGLDGVCEPLESIEAMASQYLCEIRQHQPHGPYYFLGACFGATVAFEMARQVLDAGETVAFLGLLDPSSRGGDPAAHGSLRLPPRVKRGLALGHFIADRLRLYRKEMRGLGFSEKLRFVAKKARFLGEAFGKRDVFRGDRSEFNQRRVYDANMKALLLYRCESLADGPLTFEIFKTERVINKTSAKVRVDWDAVAGARAAHHTVAGKDSGDMLQGDNVKPLASLLSSRLRHARRT